MNPEVGGHLVVATRAPVCGAERSDGGARGGGEGGGGEGGGEGRRNGFAAVHHTLREREREKHLHCCSGHWMGRTEQTTEVTAGIHLVYTGFHSHHDGVAKHFPILRQSFPGL